MSESTTYERAVMALNEFFADKSIERASVRDGLRALSAEIEIMLDALDRDQTTVNQTDEYDVEEPKQS